MVGLGYEYTVLVCFVLFYQHFCRFDFFQNRKIKLRIVVVVKSGKVELVVKKPPVNAGDVRDTSLMRSVLWEFSLWGQDPLEEGMATHSRILSGESHRQRSLAGYHPRGHKESQVTEVTAHTREEAWFIIAKSWCRSPLFPDRSSIL